MLKKIKSLFIIEDESQDSNADASYSAQKDPEGRAETKSESTAPVEKPVFDEDNPAEDNVDEKFINKLLGAIEENNIEGFDYLEYKQALQNLENVEMDEETRFKSALAVAKTMGANRTVLISSANHYLKVLEKEEKKFLEAFRHQLEKQVNRRHTEIENIQKAIESKKAQIKQIEEEIIKYTEKLDQAKAGVEGAMAKVESAKTGFYSAFHIVSEQIKDDLKKIKAHLG